MSNNIGDIKESAQILDTATVQWLNANPPDHIQSKLTEAREFLSRGQELADASLRIALVGEFNSGKTLLLNSLLDTNDLFPSLLQPTTGNVLEVKVSLRDEEKPAEIRGADVSFFNTFEIENILEQYYKDLKAQGVDGLPSKADTSLAGLEKLEKMICKKFQETRAITPRYIMIAALEFIVALRNNRALVVRDERHHCGLPTDLISSSLTLGARPEINKGIQNIYNQLKQQYPSSGSKLPDRISSKNLRQLFPMIRRVSVDVSAWCVPFGINNSSECGSISFLDFPGLGAESSSSRDFYLCASEIRDAHCVLVVFNGANPGTSGASTMANLFQKAGKLTSERTIIAVNRFDEFHPLPSGKDAAGYYTSIQDGTTVGFSTISVPAKNMMGSAAKGLNLYLCSALCYLYDEKAARPGWNFGKAKWFDDKKRQSAYTMYKRSCEDFGKICDEVKSSRTGNRDHQVMAEGLGGYMNKGGIPNLRESLVKFAISQGERLIREDSLKEIRSGVRILDETAPALQEGEGSANISPEVNNAAHEFYRVLELAVADTLPSGGSDYKKLKIKSNPEDVTLWEAIETEIASSVSRWPEWFAIINQKQTNPTSKTSSKPTKGFSRYSKIKKPGGTVPTDFSAFNDRFRDTSTTLTQLTLERVSEAIVYSLQRFEKHPDYQDGIANFQSMVNVSQLPNMEEALPLLDVWEPSKLTEDIVPMVQERVEEEVQALENLAYPYDASKPCFWNLALIIRIQVQLVKTYRDRLSRLVASAENNFQHLFCNEILRAEILPIVRSTLNNPEFLGEVAVVDGSNSWENVGQVVRVAVNQFKDGDGPKGLASMVQQQQSTAAVAEEEDEFEEEEAPQNSATSTATAAAAGAVGAAATAAAFSEEEEEAGDEFEEEAAAGADEMEEEFEEEAESEAPEPPADESSEEESFGDDEEFEEW